MQWSFCAKLTNHSVIVSGPVYVYTLLALVYSTFPCNHSDFDCVKRPCSNLGYLLCYIFCQITLQYSTLHFVVIMLCKTYCIYPLAVWIQNYVSQIFWLDCFSWYYSSMCAINCLLDFICCRLWMYSYVLGLPFMHLFSVKFQECFS